MIELNSPDGGGDESAQDQRRQRAWQELFGQAAPDWEDEALAPPIDEAARERLRAYVRGELPPQERRAIVDLQQRFRSWSQAVIDALNESRNRRSN